jgi:hypothetical protein
MGRPSRLLRLQYVLERLIGEGDVSFCRMADLARSIADAAARGASVPRIGFPHSAPVPEAVEIRAQTEQSEQSKEER